ncbi:MAG: hypothetical protein AAFY65_12735 [Pseudomonadota bacterium]
MDRRTKIILTLIIGTIVVAHVFLWLSTMPFPAKVAFTVLNATGWAIVLGPVWLVPRWLEAVKARNAAARDQAERSE